MKRPRLRIGMRVRLSQTADRQGSIVGFLSKKLVPQVTPIGRGVEAIVSWDVDGYRVLQSISREPLRALYVCLAPEKKPKLRHFKPIVLPLCRKEDVFAAADDLDSAADELDMDDDFEGNAAFNRALALALRKAASR